MRGQELLASEVASQIALHAEYGGVVPEVASRNHLRTLQPVIDRALAKARVTLDEVDAFIRDPRPGPATSLMIGTSVAKALAIGVSQTVHWLSITSKGISSRRFFNVAGEDGVLRQRPAIALIVSGGHTLLIEIEDFGRYHLLGETQDDAAGEAFDKVGKLLGLPRADGPNVDRMGARR